MASTYVNDLRLNEMATGDQSGSWGTVTNTNLELIGEAFSYGTEAITTNADTHTTTISDGATAPGRSMFLKYTGTLDSACTITIGPNTVNKMWFIENATTGSQNIIISQGSGANITIAAGQTKAVYSDGAGAGAAFVDAFATLSVVDLLVDDDLTVTDDVAIGGLATVGGTLGVTGVVTANAGVVVDNFTLDGTTLALSSGSMTLDSASQIILDAAGGNFQFLKSGTEFARIFESGSDLYIYNPISDQDIKFYGNDGGSEITALTLDMSEAGNATFNSNVLLLDNRAFVMGGGSDFQIYHEPDVNIIQAVTSDQDIVFKGNDGGSTITALTLDMSEAGAATFNNNVTAYSDERLKENIVTVPDALAKVTAMRGVHYNRIDTGRSHTGVVAQEIQKIAPELVLTADDEIGTLSVDYGNITGYLIEAIKELKLEIETLKGN
jgi:hypothetical protein